MGGLFAIVDTKNIKRSKSMKWNELTNEQRDKIIHKKVMGAATLCPGKLIASRVDVPSRAGGTAYTYWELACDTCETIGSAESEDAIPGEHPSEFPVMDYSTDLNDAWRIMDHLKPGRRGNIPFQQGEFMQV